MAEWRGLDRMLARLARVPAVVREALEDQLDEEADQLAAAIRRAAPKLTGTMARTIRARKGRRPLTRYVTVGGPETTVKIRRGVSDRDFARARRARGGNRGAYDYTRAVEFGHLTVNGVHVPGQPFIFPTYRARRKAMRRRLAAAGRGALKKLFPTGAAP